MTPLHTAIRGCFKEGNPKFKETIDKLIALGADTTVKETTQFWTAKQYAMNKLMQAFKDHESKDYEDVVEKFKSCDECVMKKEKFGIKYWSIQQFSPSAMNVSKHLRMKYDVIILLGNNPSEFPRTL